MATRGKALMTGRRRVLPHVDIDTPNVSRVYDYLLGGALNFEADRAYAEKLVKIMPDLKLVMQENRDFLQRAVRFLLEAGITQFLDLGSGLPVFDSTHQIAPDARVVYVDNDELTVTHSEIVLAGNPRATMVLADITKPDTILNHPVTRGFLDFDQPIAVVVGAVMHFVHENPVGVLGCYRDATAPGSYLVLSHLTGDNRPEVDYLHKHHPGDPTQLTYRDRGEVTELLTGYDLVAPGVVFTSQWRPDTEVANPHRSGVYAAVGHLT
ncbi:MAG: SAM-dependent methyltransferase [Candidatus Dormibacteria bacterium]